MDRRKWKARGQKHNSKKGGKTLTRIKHNKNYFLKKRFNNIELKQDSLYVIL